MSVASLRKQDSIDPSSYLDYLDSIYTGVETAIFVLDVDEFLQIRYAGLNPAHERMTGLTTEFIKGKTPFDLVPIISMEAASSIDANYRRCLTLASAIEYEECIFISGVETWWATKLTPIRTSDGTIRRIVGNSIPITERKATERRLREFNTTLEDTIEARTRVLQTILQERQDILGVVAHDIRNPLAGIQLQLEVAKQLLKKDDPQKVEHCLERISLLAENISAIVGTLIDMERLDHQSHALAIKPLDVNELVAEVVAQHQDVADRKKIDLVTGPWTAPVMVRSNADALTRILQNLISNAIKFGRPGDTVMVRLVFKENEPVCISVVDTGPGMSQEDKSNLFRRFRRLSAKPTGGEESIGLGLSIVKQLCEHISAEISCESELGKGTKFNIMLPRA